jgi:predicted transcriptional regulator
MGTTTIRVDTDTHRALLELAAESNSSLMETTRAAAEALRRQRFAHRVTEELDALRADPAAWAEYLADAERTSVGDGIS